MPRKHPIAQLYSPSTKLSQALAEYPAGTWVAISQDQQRIVGFGPTAGGAERRAEASGHAPSLVLQIPRGFVSKAPRNGNGASGSKSSMPLDLPSYYRGIYKRVARRLGCDPSYVSRVARGERTSDAISQALQSELSQAAAFTNKRASKLVRKNA